MSKNIEIKGNYIYVTDTVTTDVFDQSTALVEFRKKTNTSDLFTVFYKNYAQRTLKNLIWSDFTLEGVAFASQAAFEDWKNENTGRATGTGGGGGTPIDTAKVAVIGSGDWSAGGEGVGSTHYFVYTHGLGTNNLSFEARDTDGDFVRQLNDYYTTGLDITDGLNQVRIETSDNSLNVAVLISNGGSAVTILGSDTEEPFEEVITFKGGNRNQLTTQTGTLTLDLAVMGHASGSSSLIQWIDGNNINALTSIFNIRGDVLDNNKRNSISYIFNNNLVGSFYDRMTVVNQVLPLPESDMPNLLSITVSSPNLNEFKLLYDENLHAGSIPDLSDIVINGTNTATFTNNNISISGDTVTVTTDEDVIDLEVITMDYVKNASVDKRIRDISFNEAAAFAGTSVSILTSFVNYITFDNTILDQSGSGALNTTNGTPITFDAGDKKQGTHSGVFNKTGFIDTDIVLTDSYTKFCWIKRNASGTTTANGLIANTSAPNAYMFIPNNGNIQCGHASFASVVASAPAVGVWGSVCVTYDEPSKHMELYIDGVSVDFSDDQDSAAGGSIGFGNDNGGVVGVRGFYGLMDDARLYDKALSSAEVLSIHNEYA
jgi:hypothetical protein